MSMLAVGEHLGNYLGPDVEIVGLGAVGPVMKAVGYGVTERALNVDSAPAQERTGPEAKAEHFFDSFTPS